MTRKDYIVLALALHSAKPTNDESAYAVWADTTVKISDALEMAYPNFDRMRFQYVCAGGELNV